MKNTIITISLFLVMMTTTCAQSYLYDKGASGPAVSYSRIFGTNLVAFDYTFKGRVSIGGTINQLFKNEVYGFNGLINVIKLQREKSSKSVPLILGYQNFNGKTVFTIGGGYYFKGTISDNFSTSIGLSYARSILLPSNNNFKSDQIGLDLILIYKNVKLGPSVYYIDNIIAIGFTGGIIFNYKNTSL